MWAQGKSIYQGSDFTQMSPQNHLGPGNPSFRGNLFVPEGSRSASALLNMPTGVVLQELPFEVELKKFKVEYYDTGMPKLFASDIVIHDRETGTTQAATPAAPDGSTSILARSSSPMSAAIATTSSMRWASGRIRMRPSARRPAHWPNPWRRPASRKSWVR